MFEVASHLFDRLLACPYGSPDALDWLTAIEETLGPHEAEEAMRRFYLYHFEEMPSDEWREIPVGSVNGHSPANAYCRDRRKVGRHRPAVNGVCSNCGRRLPEDEYKTCAVCRARFRRRNPAAVRGRHGMRSNRKDPHCRHERTKRWEKDRKGDQRIRCLVCGRTWLEGREGKIVEFGENLV